MLILCEREVLVVILEEEGEEEGREKKEKAGVDY